MTSPSPHRLIRHACALLLGAALALGVTSSAHAAINNFSFVSIVGLGPLKGELSSRLGTASNATEHRINIADCERYAGGEIDVSVKVDPRPSGYQYAAAYAPPGKTCPVTDANPRATDGECYVPIAQRELTSSTVTFTVRLDALMGSACDSNTQGSATIYFIIQNTSLAVVQSEQIAVQVDLRAPSTPTLDTVTAGDARFTASWTDSANDSAATKYVVYYDDTPFGDDDLSEVNSKTGITNKSYAVDRDVWNDVTYYVSVAARDDSDNESAISNQLTVTPAETTDFWDAYQQAGGAATGGFCFIATAAYGTPMEAELTPLRAFRDQILLASDAGRWFVAAYYETGRFAAAFIADKPVLRFATRVLLVPLVWFAELALALGPLPALTLLTLLALACLHLRRRQLLPFALDRR